MDSNGTTHYDVSLTRMNFRRTYAYQVADNISVEGGYTASTYTDKQYDYDDLKLSGFFLGARASF